MNRTCRAVAVSALTAALVACHHDNPVRAEAPDLGCRQVTSAIDGMHDNLAFPPYFSERNPGKRGGEFDANRVLGALPHVAMRDGYTLDYVYHQDGMGGYPLLYARPADQQPYADESEYQAAPDQPNYLSFITPQDNAQGYLEYAILAQTANQFYLDWHANYNDWQVVCSSDDIEDVIRSLEDGGPGRPITDAQKQAARAIVDPEPSVVLDDTTAKVTMLVFTKWGGFYRRTLTINRSDHAIVDESDQPLVEYDCGIAF